MGGKRASKEAKASNRLDRLIQNELRGLIPWSNYQMSFLPKLALKIRIPPKAVFQSEICYFRRNPKTAETSIHLEFPGIYIFISQSQVGQA